MATKQGETVVLISVLGRDYMLEGPHASALLELMGRTPHDAAKEVSVEEEADSSSTNVRAGDYDHFAGWYEVQHPVATRDAVDRALHKIYVPVVKRGGEFYTSFVGLEVPMEKTGEGLYLKCDNSVQQQRMTIGYQPQSGTYYARIVLRSAYEDYSDPESAHEGVNEYRLVKTDRPAEAGDPTALPPEALDDFVGWYEPVYLRGYYHARILKEGGKFFSEGRRANGDPDGERTELKPVGMGFRVGESDYRFHYNAALHQYEQCRSNESFVVSMPLRRIDKPSSNTSPPMVWLGYPFGKD